jgi:hypothetical protein
MIPDLNFEECLSGMTTELEKKIIRELVKSKKILGVDAKYLSYSSGNDTNISSEELSQPLQEELTENAEDLFWESLSTFQDAVDNHPNGFVNRESY